MIHPDFAFEPVLMRLISWSSLGSVRRNSCSRWSLSWRWQAWRRRFFRMRPGSFSRESSRNSPVFRSLQGGKRIFGGQGRIEAAKAIFKFFAISIVVTIVLRAEEAVAVNALFGDPTAVPELILTTAMRLVSTISIATIVLVALDLVWARFHWRRELRMTKQELKDEFKQAEGDPLIKSRLRSLARDRARKTMLAAVPRATLVDRQSHSLRRRAEIQARRGCGPHRACQGAGSDCSEDQGDRGAEQCAGRRRQDAGPIDVRCRSG